MIDSVRSAVLALLNKHNYGYLSPGDFNLYAKLAQLDIHRNMFAEYTDNVLKENLREMGTGYAGGNERLQSDIDRFLVPDFELPHVSDNIFTLPNPVNSNHEMFKIVRVLCFDVSGTAPKYMGEAEYVPHGTIQMLMTSPLTSPTERFPAYSLVSGDLMAYPVSFGDAGAVRMAYIRLPLPPRWTYQVLAGGIPVFDQSQPDFIDFEVGAHYETDLVMRICQHAGVQIREMDVYGVAKREIMDRRSAEFRGE